MKIDKFELKGEPQGLLNDSGEVVGFHVFDQPSISALNASLFASRPLLVRGEPGVGKTQLAKAAANYLKWPFVSYTVDSRTESRDLMWSFDAIQRLADAQLRGAAGQDRKTIREELQVKNYIRPGSLWWAFRWNQAKGQAKKTDMPVPHARDQWQPGQGVVILIDEIDKAESDVPNGLLEALGSRQFTPQGFETVVLEGQSPLVIITTNEERVLPDAFIRRCMILELQFPNSEDEIIRRGRAHFNDIDDDVIQKATSLLQEDRQIAIENDLSPLPGMAEYIDLLRTITEMSQEDTKSQSALIDEMRTYVYQKSKSLKR